MFFNVKVKYQKETADGLQFVKEEYVINAENPTDCEKIFFDEIGHDIAGDSEIVSMKKVEYYDVLNAGNPDYFNAKVDMIMVTGSGKETRRNVNVLVMSDSIANAHRDVEKFLNSLDHELIGITKTKIVDVLLGNIKASVLD